ncbi:hypothetical protein LIER_07618 [Lithospermum erythrorhizon]|uniref:Uncharacterized protein n=1 Tax=Lithospermum erythrorhizon TaxID=34254 RepID=A0AAV3P8S2_LITER
MCSDFTSINKAFPKDCYALLNIDRLVDSSAGYKVVDFLDAFRLYHQIFMVEKDVEKTVMQSPNTQKEAQRLTGRISTLTRFISRTGDRSFPFFKPSRRGRNLNGLQRRSLIGQRHQCGGTGGGSLDNRRLVGPLSLGEQHERPGKRHPSPRRPSSGPGPAKRAPNGGDWPRLPGDVSPEAPTPEPPP